MMRPALNKDRGPDLGQANQTKAQADGQVKVLVVVADPDRAQNVIQYLRAAKLNMEAVHAPGMSGALANLAGGGFHAILLDNGGTGMPVEEALKIVEMGAPDVPVIMLLEQDEGAGIEALRAGAQDALVTGELSSAALERAILFAIERKRAEASLTRYQGSYEQLVNSLDGIVWEGDALTLRFSFVSRQAERLLGYQPEQWLASPTFWQDHIYHEDRGWVVSFCRLAATERRPYEFEYRMVAADGRIVWLRDIVTVVVEDDVPVKLRGVMIDISEQKEAQEELQVRESQYHAIFEATSDGLVINDVEGRVVEVNPAFCKMHGYTREEMVGMDPRTFIHPDSHTLLEEFFNTVRSGRDYSCRAMDVRKDGSAFHVEVHGTTFVYQGRPHVLGIVRDISEQVEAYELLEQRVAERTRELTTLLEVSNNVASTLELRPLLGRVLEQLKPVADYSRASISVIESGSMTVLDSSDIDPTITSRATQNIPVERLGPMSEPVRRGEAVIIPDILEDTPYARVMRDLVADTLRQDRNATETLEQRLAAERSMMLVPLVHKEAIIGALTLRHREPGFYTEQQATLATAIANQATIAIENARLYEEAQEINRKTAALAQVASQVAFGGSLDSTMAALCQHVVGITDAMASAIVLHDSTTGQTTVMGAFGLPQGYDEALNEILRSGVNLLMHRAFAGREPVLARDMRNALLNSPEYGPLHRFMHDVPWDTVVAVPMIYRARHVGVLLSYHDANRNISEAEMTFHSVIADQAAVAVENAHLLAEANDKARLEERQRLARELHDSVTQALFSINLIARSAETVMKREGTPLEQIQEKMADLRQLTQSALAEMRALIFELRPGALEEEGLLEALRKHAAAVQGREMLRVDVACSLGHTLPRLKPTAEEALYRIAQEALHNVVKHARATRVTISIETELPALVMKVSDDGAGFDVANVPAGHMGLGTMGQRAAALGGSYYIDSSPGRGTTVTVSVPLEEWRL